MKMFSPCLLSLTVACLLASSLFAADEQPAAKGKKKAKKAPATVAAFKLPDAIQLTAEQQTKVDELKIEYSDKLRDATQKVNDVYTAEQLAASQSARKTAVAEGKKGKELKAAVEAAVQLSDEQRKKRDEAQTQLSALQKEVRQKLVALLTDEQKEHIKVKAKKKNA